MMDRISKALEMAKSNGASASPRNLQADTAQSADFDYTQTQRAVADKAVLQRHRVISAMDDKQIVDSYRLLRTRVIRRMQQNKWSTLGITSAGAGVGKTLTAVNLAISIAMKQNYTVIVVDADLRRPSVHGLFGFKPAAGLSDYLRGDTPLDQILINPDIDRFVILPGTESVDGSSELLSSPKMVQLVEDLKLRYPSRIVIFDLPPVLVGDDVVAFAPYLDTALLVVEEGGTQTPELEKSIELLESIEIMGTVMNKSTDKTHSYDYYY